MEMINNDRSTKLKKNTISSVVFYIISLSCGFILPRLILTHFGSEVNGLVGSITQFLSVISFLELGVGAVVQSTLYKPLADNNEQLISQIIRSANRFYRAIALVLVIYVSGLVLIFPLIVNGKFDIVYTTTLIAAMSCSTFAQYYFGIVDSFLLYSDQRGYIHNNSMTISLIVNTVLSVILIKSDVNIQIVKLSTSIVYIVRPVLVRLYINNHYSIDRRIDYSEEPIKQKWNGIAQHIAAIVLDQTDVIVLTLFSTLSSVSVYNVYHLVVFGIKSFIMYTTNGIRALLGDLWARKDFAELERLFAWSEWVIHSVTIILFGCTASLIVPFVRVYTRDVYDANYIVPAFAILITIANALHCLRLPYNLMILAAGHFKQTQSNYIIAATINLFVSIITVRYWGLVGVAVGTIVAMSYQTIWMVWYDSKNIVNTPINGFIKHLLVDLLVFIPSLFLSSIFSLRDLSVVSWVMLSLKVIIIWISVSAIINYGLYRDYTKRVFKWIGLS